MEVQSRGFDPFEASVGVAGILMFLLWIAFIVFWMVVAWRAMRAHERIADALVERDSSS